MTKDITEKSKQDDSAEHKLNRKDIIHLGFQNKTKGEAAFNLISYVGFGYFLVTATSVAMTWLLNDKTKFGKTIGAFTKDTLKLPGSFGNIATLFMGGTLASVLPVKWLEDRKPQFVKKLDHLYYDDKQYATDPKIQEAHKELDELPKQTWGSVFTSRVVAFGLTLGTFLLAGSNKSFVARKTGHSIDELSTRAGRFLDRALFNRGSKAVARRIENIEALNKTFMDEAKYGEKALGGIEVIRDEDPLGKPIAPLKGDRDTSRVLSYITLDAFYTLITSITLWVSTRVFGAVMGVDAKKAAALAEQKHTKKAHSTPSTAPHMHTDAGELSAKQESPETRVNTATHIQRIAEPQQTAELTA